jgi:hypothetical protein
MRMAAIVADGCSSMSQYPESEMTAQVTSVATKRKLSAIAPPKVPACLRVAEAVQHDDGRTLTADPGVEGRAVGFDLFGVKTGWELLKF